MILEWVRAWNYAKFPFIEVPFCNQGIVLIEGVNNDSLHATSNGSGKTTGIRDTALVGLTGKTGEGVVYENKILDISEDKPCRLETFFIGNDGKRYCIVREFRPKKAKLVQLFHLSDEGQYIAVPTYNTVDAQYKIDELIGGDYLSLVNTCIPGADTGLYAESGESQQKRILDSLLSMAKIKKAQALATKYAKPLKETLKQLELQLRGIESSIETTNETLNSTKRARNQALQRKEQRLIELQQRIGQTSHQLQTLEIEKAQYETELQQSQNSLSETELTALSQDVQTYRSTLEQYRVEQGQLYQQLSTNADTCKFLDEKIQNAFKGKIEGETCHHCGGTIDLTNIQMMINHWNQEKATLESAYLSINQQYQNYPNLISVLQEKIKTAENLITNTRQQSERKKAILIRIAVIDQDTLNKIELKNKLVADAHTIRNEPIEADSLSIELESKLQHYQKQQEELNQQVYQARIQLKKYEIWEDCFGGGKRGLSLPMYLYNATAGEINAKIHSFTERLYGSGLKVNLRTSKNLTSGEEKAGLSIDIINEDGASEYRLNSKGERKRVNLAITLALLEFARDINNIQPNILILDELDNNMDDAGIDALMEILFDLSKEISSIFVITHKTELKSKFSKVWTIEKTNGVSNLCTTA